MAARLGLARTLGGGSLGIDAHLHRSRVRFQAFGAGQRGDGGRQRAAAPPELSSCTEITLTKSAADRPPRNRAAPEVGST